MTTVQTIDFKQKPTTSSSIEQKRIKDDDNIFASYARKAGMENFADFLRDDWTANMARKAGSDKFADWLENKPDENGNKKYNDGFFSNLARGMINHPVLTITAIAGTIFAGKAIHKAITQKSVAPITKSTVATTAPTASVVTSTTTTNTVTKTINEQIGDLNKVIDEYISKNGKNGLKNFEIFENLTPLEQERIWNYISHEKVHREKEILLFASGNKPATLEGFGSYTADLFDGLQKNKSLYIAEYFDNNNFNLLMNVDATKKVIEQNQTFFINRLGLSENSTVDEIFNTIKKGYGNNMADPNKFFDIKQLLQGNTKENAYYLQMVEDIRNVEKTKYFEAGYRSFLNRSNEGIDVFKQILKEKLDIKTSSYANMPKSFRDELIKIIDNIRPEDYERRILYKDNLILNNEFYQKQLKALQNLVEKIKAAELTGRKIPFIGGYYS